MPRKAAVRVAQALKTSGTKRQTAAYAENRKSKSAVRPLTASIMKITTVWQIILTLNRRRISHTAQQNVQVL